MSDEPQIQVSLIHPDAMGDVAVVRTGPWSALVDGLRMPAPASIAKANLPLWSPATYDDDDPAVIAPGASLYLDTRRHAPHRTAETVEAVYALGLDIDETPIPDGDTIRAALAGIRAVVHSTSSATANAPRWRGVLSLSRPVTADEYRRLWPLVTALLPFRVGQAAKDPSRMWYVPREGADGKYELIEIDGKPLDVDTLLAGADVTPTAPLTGPAPAAPPACANRRSIAAELLGRAWPRKGRHEAQLALAGALRRDGWPRRSALEILCETCRVAGDEDRPKREQTIAHTYSTSAAVTGWTRLGTHVDPVVVETVRNLLDPDADTRAAIMHMLDGRAPNPNPNPTNMQRTTPAERAMRIGGRDITRIGTGWPTIDTATRGGILARKVAVIGGAPGAGKTAMLVAHAYRCLSAGISCAVLAADEDADALLIHLGQLHKLSRDALESGEPGARQALATWCRSVPLILVDGDDEDASIESVSRDLRAMAGGSPSVLYVDSLQTARTEIAPPREADARARINATVAALKRAAKIDGHQVWASSELAKSAYRSAAQRENTNPLAAFKESGDIEYGVALALVLISHPGTSNIVDGVIAKNRLGPGKPEFMLRLDHDRADVVEASMGSVTALDPLFSVKAEILELLSRGASLKTKGQIAERVGGNRSKVWRAITELLDAHQLHHGRDGIRLPLPGDPGYREYS